MTDLVYDAISKIDDNGEQLIGTVQMVMGDGTSKVAFHKGRARVPAHLAEMVASDPRVDVIGWDGNTTVAPTFFAPGAAPTGVMLPPAVAEHDGLVARVGELEAMLRDASNMIATLAAKVDQPVKEVMPTPAVPPAPADPGIDRTGQTVEQPEVSDKVRAAMEYLAEEGEDVPEPGSALTAATAPPAAHPGFEAATADGQPRCQAAKGDGSQCTNPAAAGAANPRMCGLAKHQGS